jgi:hypothetical protein
MHKPNKIISGGQTGADLGGLVGARRTGIATGGMAPRDYKTEVGNKPEELKAFGLIAHPSPKYNVRTKENVLASDATLIIATDPDSDGTKLTIKYCDELSKPYLIFHPNDESLEPIVGWLDTTKPNVLNVAGNRESKSKGLTSKTAAIITKIFE